MMVFGEDALTQADVDRNTKALHVTPRPPAGRRYGTYAVCLKTGTMAAGLAGAAPVLSFRWGAPDGDDTGKACLLRRVSAAMNSLGTGFTAGVGQFDLILASSFTTADTGGTATPLKTVPSKNGGWPSCFADLRISSTATLSAGTRTLDGFPVSSKLFPVTTATNFVHLATTDLFTATRPDEQPILFSANAGFIIRATVPATGTWNGIFCLEFDEALPTMAMY